MKRTKAMLGAPARAWVLTVGALACAAAFGAAPVSAQGEAAKGAPATVSGRVTDGKRGLPGIVVMLMLNSDRGPFSAEAAASAKTDAEGHYRVGGLTPGRYQVMPVAPAHVVAGDEGDDARRSRVLLLAPGEAVEKVDFRLTRGGVITGRVTGADGRPLAGEFVQVTGEQTPRPAHGYARPDRTEMMTDDRGVYRVYGLPAGRYRVSVGSDGPPRGRGTASADGVKTYNRRTYYRDTTVAAEAKLVEVTEGSETTDIDIRVEKASRQTYSATGRIVFAETGQPAANVRVGYGPAGRGDGRGVGFAGGGISDGVVTDARGEFKLEGLVSGRYVAYAVREGSPDWYGEEAVFRIADADAEGIEVKLKRGVTVSGVVQFEGVADRALVSNLLGRARVQAYVESPTGGPPVPVVADVAADGSFRLAGLQPGKARFGLGAGRGVMMLRVEHNGADATRGLEVAEGAQVAGVRVVAGYGNAVVRGQVNVTGGTLAQGWALRVFARPVGTPLPVGFVRSAEADSRGNFVLEDMLAGEYEFRAVTYFMGVRGGPPRPPQQGGRSTTGPVQRVVVAHGGEHSVTLVLPVGEGANQ